MRVSPLTKAPRRAVNPANALLNYLYAILEAEARIAALSVGADPLLGVLHADARGRDSLACDLMEPARPTVDAYVLDLFLRREFGKDDFFELPDGQCRLLPPLTEELIRTGPRWARAVLPEARRLAATLLEAGNGPGRAPTAEHVDGRRRPGHPVGGRGVSKRPRRGNQVVMREHSLLTPIQAGEVPDSRQAPEAPRRRGAAIRRTQAENKRWVRGSAHTEPSVFRNEIAPFLKDVPLRVLMEATGLTKGSCSRIRAGKTVPHPRHLEALTAASTRL